MARTVLVAVAGGSVYHRYATALMATARTFFRPTSEVAFHIIEGEEGWPNGTMHRPKRLLEWIPSIAADFIYLCDADMRFEAPCGPEVLPPDGHGFVATLHPGYVGRPWVELPFETRVESACYVLPERRERYFCGGFWGGSRAAVEGVTAAMVTLIERDALNGIVPQWHDESSLNAVLAHGAGPDLILDPSMCHPDADAYYLDHVWREPYERVLVALDKTRSERGDR